MADTIKKIGIQNDDGSYNYTDIGVDADKVDIGNTTLDVKINTIETKLSGIAEGANKTTVDTALSSTSTNPVQNKVVNTALGNKVDKVSGKGLSTNDYTTTEKTKLSGIAAGAEVNQNAFAKVVVGSTTIAADTKTDSLTIAAGSNVTITPDATNDKITIAATDTKYSAATTSAAGLMSAADKTKLDGIAEGAGAVTVDTALSSTSTNPVQNKVVNTAINAKAPTTHASSATTYGKGSPSNYGHLKINDNYTASPSTSFNASAGVAASMYSAQKLYEYASLLNKRLDYLDDGGYALVGTATFTGAIGDHTGTEKQQYGNNAAMGSVKLSENATSLFKADSPTYTGNNKYVYATGIKALASGTIPTKIQATSDYSPMVYGEKINNFTYHHPDIHNPITSSVWGADNSTNIGKKFYLIGGFAFSGSSIGVVGKDHYLSEAALQNTYYTDGSLTTYFLTNGPGIMYFYEKITL